MPRAQTLQSMLREALVSYARGTNFQLEEEAASFIAARAAENINRRNFEDAARFPAAELALAALPQLATMIRAQTANREFPDRASVANLMKTCSGPYPWCSSAP